MKKHVLVAPNVDKPEAPVRESFDSAFCHLTNSSKKCSGASTENTVFRLLRCKTPFYQINRQKAMAPTRERVREYVGLMGHVSGLILASARNCRLPTCGGVTHRLQLATAAFELWVDVTAARWRTSVSSGGREHRCTLTLGRFQAQEVCSPHFV